MTIRQAAQQLEHLEMHVLNALVEGRLEAPFAVLGPQRCARGWRVLALLPGADGAMLRGGDGDALEMQRLHDAGVFVATMAERPCHYVIEARGGAARWRVFDPYQFGPALVEEELRRFAQGCHEHLWRLLGAHPSVHEGVAGVRFAVWAPRATRVSVIGDFNQWDGRRHPMRRHPDAGVWELFIPELGVGARYKYEVLPVSGGRPLLKSDPFAFRGEVRPGNASIVCDLDRHDWQDGQWPVERAGRQRADVPISIYEVHLGSWRRRADGRWLSYRELADALVPYVRDLGFTHIEILPPAEHPFDGSWGYQPIGLYAPTSRFGDPEDFRALIEACHRAGLGVILDWVPAHFPEDPHGLARFDGAPLYEYADLREGAHPEWNTLIYDYRSPQVCNFLRANARYWLYEYHVDGLRVDAVAAMLYRDYNRPPGAWIPNVHGGRENLEAIAFLQKTNEALRADDPAVLMIAEESTAWPGVTRPAGDGGLGFGFKWNMGWMHDTLQYMQIDPIRRTGVHGTINFALHYAFDERFILPLSHDEVVHGAGSIWSRMPGDTAQKFANLRVYYSLMFAHPGKKLLFMGAEWGQRAEWDADGQLDWGALDDPAHAGVRNLVRDLNRLYRRLPALHRRDADRDGFQWIEGSADQANVFAWIRRGTADELLVAVFNFSGLEQRGWRIGVPRAGRWAEVLNSDAGLYGGAERGNFGGVVTHAVPSHGQSDSVIVTLPPLTGLYFTWMKC